jgi:hypothetical protein
LLEFQWAAEDVDNNKKALIAENLFSCRVTGGAPPESNQALTSQTQYRLPVVRMSVSGCHDIADRLYGQPVREPAAKRLKARISRSSKSGFHSHLRSSNSTHVE